MKKYSIISNNKRKELIQRVTKKGESVIKVSKQLRIKLPSAKSIIRTFKNSGKIFDKKKLISQKINIKRAESSDTENQSEALSLNQQKTNKKQEREEPSQKRQYELNQVKQGFSLMQSSFKVYANMDNMEKYLQEYYTQMYNSQEIHYFFNLLPLFKNQGIFIIRF